MEPKFQGEGVVPREYFFGFYKTRHILLSNSANCTVLRAVVLTQYRRVTDRQTDGRTDGIAIANTALAMLALRRAVKTGQLASRPGLRQDAGQRGQKTGHLSKTGRVATLSSTRRQSKAWTPVEMLPWPQHRRHIDRVASQRTDSAISPCGSSHGSAAAVACTLPDFVT